MIQAVRSREGPRITGTFVELESVVTRILAGEHGQSREALRRVFRLNTEIGRLAASDATLRVRLRELQVALNGVTVALKHEDWTLLRGSLETARLRLRDVER